MWPLLVAGLTACALAVVLTRVALFLAPRWRFLDRPGSEAHKQHAAVVPYGGGPAMGIALAVALAAPALAKSPPPAAAQGPEEPIEVQIKPSPTKAAPSKKAQDHFRSRDIAGQPDKPEPEAAKPEAKPEAKPAKPEPRPTPAASSSSTSAMPKTTSSRCGRGSSVRPAATPPGPSS